MSELPTKVELPVTWKCSSTDIEKHLYFGFYHVGSILICKDGTMWSAVMLDPTNNGLKIIGSNLIRELAKKVLLEGISIRISKI